MVRRTTVALWASVTPMLLLLSSVCAAAPYNCGPAASSSRGPIPPDAFACNGPTPQIDAFANLMWQAFKMIVWPAEVRRGRLRRGVADPRRSLADLRGPRVFETFKADWETFLPSASPPSEWTAYSATATACRNNPRIDPGDLVLADLAEFGNVQEQGGNDQSGGSITNVLVGQNRKLVRYLVAFDQKEFDLILKKKLYDASHSSGAAAAPDGTIIVKSAWLELEGLNVDHGTFYRRRALVQDPETLKCREAVVGLVGLHIRYKTPTRPHWIWASFEHVRNVPPAGEGASRSQTQTTNSPSAYIFNDGSGTPMPDRPPPDTRLGSDTFSAHPAPYNVQRLKPIAPELEDANRRWQASLAGTPWANYQLVLVEWPGLGSSSKISALEAKPEPPSFTNQHSNLVNTTMETFLQNGAGPTSQGMRFTCMGCHNGARQVDYVFTILLNAKSPAHIQKESRSRREMIDYLRSIVDPPAR